MELVTEGFGHAYWVTENLLWDMIESDIHAINPSQNTRVIDDIRSEEYHHITHYEKEMILDTDWVNQRDRERTKEVSNLSFWEGLTPECDDREYRKESKSESHTETLTWAKEDVDHGKNEYIKEHVWSCRLFIVIPFIIDSITEDHDAHEIERKIEKEIQVNIGFKESSKSSHR